MQKSKLILGSQSPRRNELLKMLYLPFEVETSDIEEKTDKTDVVEAVMDLAAQKSGAVYDRIKDDNQNYLVIGSDTIVVIDNEILGKPHTRKKAKEMLLKLSGREHLVYTGVSLKGSGVSRTFYDCTKVVFDPITEDLLELYLDTEESLDKAGGYGVQSYALSFIKSLEGSYSSVVGLPVNLLLQQLKEIAVEKGENLKEWRKYFV